MAKAFETGKLAGWFDKVSGYALAVATTCTATGIRIAMQQELHDRGRMLLLVPAVMLTAWYGGVGPGLFAIALGVFLCGLLVIPPANKLNFGDRSEQLSTVIFTIVVTGIILLVHRERQEKQKREAAQEELVKLNQLLENRVRERTLELEIANHELERFCYNVSHDLRTPTRAIVGNIGILIEDFGDKIDGPVRIKLGRISAAAMKLSDQVDALLTYARLAKSGLQHEPVDLGALLSAEVRHLADKLGISMRLEKPANLVVTGDEQQMRRAIEAIVSNTVKYAKAGEKPRLAITSNLSGSDVVISFQDDGIGFDMQYVHKIFEPFERLHRDESYPGVGMGLANVARIAERHHGAVWAESTLGDGATIHFRLGNQEPIEVRVPERLSA
jgi:signal transduction histidine kinase